MNPITESIRANRAQQENATLRDALTALRCALARATDENELLTRRLSTAADKQILLLNRLIAVKDTPHLNPASTLPPVECPLLIELEPCRLVRAERTSFVQTRDEALAYRLSDGELICGRYRWTYP